MKNKFIHFTSALCTTIALFGCNNTEEKHYLEAKYEFVSAELNGEDIITSSGEMAEIEFAKKGKNEAKEMKFYGYSQIPQFTF